jgi:prepilin-type N-terminal cleavage/methylation domain-containing protein
MVCNLLFVRKAFLDMKQRGFTLIEIMVAIVFVTILIMIAIPAIVGAPMSNGNVSWGVNGMTESRCIEGYRFVLDQKGNARQILDEFGKGVRCELIEPGKPGSFGRM